jgi:flagellar biogenesis protein FliO
VTSDAQRKSTRRTAGLPKPAFFLLSYIVVSLFLVGFPLTLPAQTDASPKGAEGTTVEEAAHGESDPASATSGEEGSAGESTAGETGGITEGNTSDRAQDAGETGGENGNGLYPYEPPDFGGTEVSYTMLILRTIGIMGALLIGLYLVYRLLIKKRSRIVTDSEIIRVLATYPLAGNRVIQIMDIAGEILVLGVSDANINLISKVEDRETIDRIKLLSNRENPGATTFKDQLLNLIGGKGLGRTDRVASLGGYRRRIERMRKL